MVKGKCLLSDVNVIIFMRFLKKLCSECAKQDRISKF